METLGNNLLSVGKTHDQRSDGNGQAHHWKFAYGRFRHAMGPEDLPALSHLSHSKEHTLDFIGVLLGQIDENPW